MQNGLYRVEFNTPLGAGAGVVTLRDGKLWGGDSDMYYVGTFNENGDDFVAQVATDRHTKTAAIASVFGIDRVNIVLQGKSNGDVAQMTGRAAEVPNVSFSARLSKIAE